MRLFFELSYVLFLLACCYDVILVTRWAANKLIKKENQP